MISRSFFTSYKFSFSSRLLAVSLGGYCENFKEKFQKIDFLIPFLIFVPLAQYFYQQSAQKERCQFDIDKMFPEKQRGKCHPKHYCVW